MPKKSPHRTFSIDEDLCQRVVAIKATLGRREALTPFIQWVLEMFCKEHEDGRIVRRVAAVKGENELAERKQAS